ncbi:adenine-specific methyltransferase EcoRI family protein [Mycoplasmopsis agassizii]|uniref:adenine-specific methyltransferase EcoRI family protein n=1 Tax=Mycoplasmopsis agassizii TaxID=33922 RepID=UPI001F27655F|nr:adenine-specific methyltransferase EcoRI family protein [Mycoplasmopsis agassizii]
MEVPSVSAIPSDYDGVMGVPITFLDKYNPEQFEILGLASGRNEFDIWPSKRYLNTKQYGLNGAQTNGSKVNTGPTIKFDEKPNSKIYYTADNSEGYLTVLYARVLIKRK